MAKPLLITKYPAKYFDLIQAFSAHDLYQLPFDTPREAKAFRFDFYGFLRALSRSVELGFQADAGKLHTAYQYTLKIQGATVRFERKDTSAFAKAIQASFALNGDVPVTSPPSAAVPDSNPQPSTPPLPPVKQPDAMQSAIEAAGYAITPATTAKQPTDSPPTADFTTFMNRKGNSDDDL